MRAEDLLRVTLELEAWRTFSGESLRFVARVENACGAAVRGLIVPEPMSPCISLVLRSGGDLRRVTARQVYASPGEAPAVRPEQRGVLRAGAHWELRGDLRAWFGEIAPGDYMLTAEYRSPPVAYESVPVPLKVAPARTRALHPARIGPRGPGTPLPAARIAVCDKAARLYFELLDPRRPEQCLASIPTGIEPADGAPVVAGAMCRAKTPAGHVVCAASPRELSVATIDLEDHRVTGRTVRAPFAGAALRSPMSMPDGRLMIPFLSEGRDRAALIELPRTGEARVTEIDLGGHGPIGPCLCHWQMESFLHLFWARPEGLEVFASSTSLSGVDRRMTAPRLVYAARDPILWLDGYITYESPPAPHAALHGGETAEADARLEPPEPLNRLWVIGRRGGQITTTLVRVEHAYGEPRRAFDCGSLEGVSVVDSLVDRHDRLALLLADSQQRLFRVSEDAGNATPLVDQAGRAVPIDHSPILVPGPAAQGVQYRVVERP